MAFAPGVLLGATSTHVIYKDVETGDAMAWPGQGLATRIAGPLPAEWWGVSYVTERAIFTPVAIDAFLVTDMTGAQRIITLPSRPAFTPKAGGGDSVFFQTFISQSIQRYRFGAEEPEPVVSVGGELRIGPLDADENRLVWVEYASDQYEEGRLMMRILSTGEERELFAISARVHDLQIVGPWLFLQRTFDLKQYSLADGSLQAVYPSSPSLLLDVAMVGDRVFGVGKSYDAPGTDCPISFTSALYELRSNGAEGTFEMRHPKDVQRVIAQGGRGFFSTQTGGECPAHGRPEALTTREVGCFIP